MARRLLRGTIGLFYQSSFGEAGDCSYYFIYVGAGRCVAAAGVIGVVNGYACAIMCTCQVPALLGLCSIEFCFLLIRRIVCVCYGYREWIF